MALVGSRTNTVGASVIAARGSGAAPLPMPWGSRSPDQPAYAWKAGGSTFSAASDRATFGSSAGNSNLAQTGLTVIWLGKHGTLGANKALVVKTSATTTRGFTFQSDNVTTPGQLRVIFGVSAGNYIDVLSSAAGPLSQAGRHEACAFTIDASKVVKLYMGAAEDGVALLTSADNNTTPRGTVAVDSGDNIQVGNNNAGTTPHGGDSSWAMVYVGALTQDQINDAVTAALVCTAGNFDRGLAMMMAVGTCRLAGFIANDSTVTDFSGVAPSVAIQRSAAGTTLENDSSGAHLNQLFELSDSWEDDAECPGPWDFRQQPFYTYTSGFARRRWTTDATKVSISGWGTFIAASYAAQQAVGVEVNGAYQGQVLSGRSTPGTAGQFWGSVTGMAATTKVVGIVNGPRSRAAAPPLQDEPQQGTWARLAYFNAPATALAPTTPTAGITLVTDSIGEEFVANPIFQYGAWEVYRRNLPSYYDAVKHAGYGGMMMIPVNANATTLSAWADRAVAGNPARVIIQLGTNDKVNETGNAAAFQTALAAYVDAILARTSFTGRVLLISPPITAAQEGANGLGSTLDAYRTAVSTVQSTRTSRVDFMDGKTAVSVGNLAADGVHFTNAAQTEWLTAITEALRQGYSAFSTVVQGRSGTTTGTVAGTGSQSVVLLPSASGHAETSSSTSAIGTATALAAKLRVKGNVLGSNVGFIKLVQVDQTRTANTKWQWGYRSENGAHGIVMWNSTDGTFAARQAFALGSNPATFFDPARYYTLYCHYDPSSGTEILRGEVYDDTGTLVASGSNNTQITGALPNNAAYGNVRINQFTDAVAGSIDKSVDGLAIYSAVLSSGDRSTEPSASDASLLAYWPINEGSGSTIAEINGGQSMTLTNASWVSEGVWPTSGGISATTTVTQGRSGSATATVASDVVTSVAQGRSGSVAGTVSLSLTSPSAQGRSSTTDGTVSNSLTSASAQGRAGATALAADASITSTVAQGRTSSMALTAASDVVSSVAQGRASNATLTVASDVVSSVAQGRTGSVAGTVSLSLTNASAQGRTGAITGTVSLSLTSTSVQDRPSTTTATVLNTLASSSAQGRASATTLAAASDIVSSQSQGRASTTSGTITGPAFLSVDTSLTQGRAGSATGTVSLSVTVNSVQGRQSTTALTVAADLVTSLVQGRSSVTAAAVASALTTAIQQARQSITEAAVSNTITSAITHDRNGVVTAVVSMSVTSDVTQVRASATDLDVLVEVVSSIAQDRQSVTALQAQADLTSALTQVRAGTASATVLSSIVSSALLDRPGVTVGNVEDDIVDVTSVSQQGRSSLTTIAALAEITSLLQQQRSGVTAAVVANALAASSAQGRASATELITATGVQSQLQQLRQSLTALQAGVQLSSIVGVSPLSVTSLAVLVQIVSDLLQQRQSVTQLTQTVPYDPILVLGELLPIELPHALAQLAPLPELHAIDTTVALLPIDVMALLHRVVPDVALTHISTEPQLTRRFTTE